MDKNMYTFSVRIRDQDLIKAVKAAQENARNKAEVKRRIIRAGLGADEGVDYGRIRSIVESVLGSYQFVPGDNGKVEEEIDVSEFKESVLT